MSLWVENIFTFGYCDYTEDNFDSASASFETNLNQQNNHVENAETLRNLGHITKKIIWGKIVL